jgi:hypothetical protein
MKKVFARVHNFGDVEVASTSLYFPIEECHSIFNRFCSENNFAATFIKATHTFDGNVLIHCRLNIEDLRELKIKTIII